MLRHACLVLSRTVVFEREDHRVGRSLERALVDRVECLVEEDVARQGEAVSNLRLAVGPVPYVDLYAAASVEQGAAVHVGARISFQLVASEVRVVRRIHVVVAERVGHILVHLCLCGVEHRVVRREDKLAEVVEVDLALLGLAERSLLL